MSVSGSLSGGDSLMEVAREAAAEDEYAEANARSRGGLAWNLTPDVAAETLWHMQSLVRQWRGNWAGEWGGERSRLWSGVDRRGVGSLATGCNATEYRGGSAKCDQIGLAATQCTCRVLDDRRRGR